MKEEYNRNPTARLLKDIQEAQKHIPLLQGQLSKATTAGQVRLRLHTLLHALVCPLVHYLVTFLI